MDLKQIGINTGNWVDSAQDKDYKSPCEREIERPDSVGYEVS